MVDPAKVMPLKKADSAPQELGAFASSGRGRVSDCYSGKSSTKKLKPGKIQHICRAVWGNIH